MKRIKFHIENKEKYLNDVQDIPRAFSPYIIIDNNADDYLVVKHKYENGIFFIDLKSNFHKDISKKFIVQNEDMLLYKSITKFHIKTVLYDYISEYSGINLPYGNISGVRPTKVYHRLLGNHKDAYEILINDYKVKPNKAELIRDIVNYQKRVYEINQNNCDIFVNIPFCPTRCNYCSFISNEIKRVKHLLDDYVKRVKKEIQDIKNHINKKGMNLRSIYIGGGTPTCIGSKNLSDILFEFKEYKVEFTVEAGRPDTINKEILDVLKNNGVTRISINPQTFNDKTLEKMGRKHTVKDFYKAYSLATEYGFDINMDLIALLEGESLSDFCNSVDCAIELSPENITTHTLSIKRGANIRNKPKQVHGLAEEMINYAHKKLYENAYYPYYMYRQKNMADNLENVGFCKKGKECIYNIDMMEEISSVFAAGAGGISKIFREKDIFQRIPNPKDINQYLSRDYKLFY